MNTAAIENARRAHQSGNRPEAVRLCREILRLNPKDFDALYLLGYVQSQLGELEDAQRLIGEALKVNPRSPDAAYNRGCILQTLTRHSEALGCFDQALASNPEFLDAFINRGISLLALKRPKEALVSFDRALKLKPDDAQAWNSRATALLQLGEPDQALASLDRALSLERRLRGGLEQSRRGASPLEAPCGRPRLLRQVSCDQSQQLHRVEQSRQHPDGFASLSRRHPGFRTRACASAGLCRRVHQSRHRADRAEGLRPRARQLYAGPEDARPTARKRCTTGPTR